MSRERRIPSREAGASSEDFTSEFTRCYRERWPSLFRYLSRLTGDPDLAADLGQEALRRLWIRGHLPRDTGAWLVSVAHNLLRDQQRKAGRRRRLFAGRKAPVGVVADPPPSPDEELARHDRVSRVRRALHSLSERDREILLLRAEGYRYREIAEALDMAPASVGKTLARALDAFEQAIDDVGLTS